MKNNNVRSTPNNTVAIICSVVKGIEDSYSIDTFEVAYGKIDDETKNFYCIDNKGSYLSLSSNLKNLEEGKTYYCFAKSVDELKSAYGYDLSINELMINYLRDILQTYSIVYKDCENNCYIHYISRKIMDRKIDSPIQEITNTQEIDDKPKKKLKYNLKFVYFI